MPSRSPRKSPTPKRPSSTAGIAAAGDAGLASPIDAMLLAALERGGDQLETGRYLVTFKEGAHDEGVRSLGAQGMRVADARDFAGQSARLADVDGADALTFPEIGVAVVAEAPAQERGIHSFAALAADSPVEIVEPETFLFATGSPLLGYLQEESDGGRRSASEYLRGFTAAAAAIARDLRGAVESPFTEEDQAVVAALGATWGLAACRVPQSTRTGSDIRVAVLDTGMDLGHPDFVGRPVASATFAGQPVQDLHSHGTHCIGTACGPLSPAGTTPRYGIAHRSLIYAAKVLSNSGSTVGGSLLAGMNWAIANRCTIISMSLGGAGGPFAAFTAAGQAALNNGLLMVAASGNEATATGSPANSPTIMSVASLDTNLRPSSFSNFGKVDIAAPGRDVFSSVPRPVRYGIKSGTSMATPHVAGCAALWAQSSSSLRGLLLWRKLQATARALGLPTTRVGAGLVQAP